jgi:uncharacterized protein (TIGR03435 family)
LPRLLASILSILSVCGAVNAQPATQFEAADLHVSPPGSTPSSGFLPGGRVELRAMTLLQLITLAYNVRPDRVSGGPNWTDTDHFDVLAKAPAGASQDAMRTMLQNLLTERLGLAIQSGDKPEPVYALSVGKRGAAKAATGEGEPGCKKANEDGLITLTCLKTSIASLAELLPQTAPAYFAGRSTVVDHTKLEGVYDFRLQWVGRGQLPPGPEGLKDGRSIFSSLEKELGLVLEPQTAPVQMLTIASVNRTPAANPPDVEAKLGPAPTEFDVAEVKPSGPGENPDFKLENGRITAKAIPLKELIAFAWNVDNDDALKGGPKWLDSELFDIVAKTAPTESDDTLRVMTRALLAERFGLKVHQETQPIIVFALTAVKPKLAVADPAERTTCKMSLADGQRAYTCTNVTMAQFAERLREAANGYVDRPIVDLTGLKGSYDFTVTWAPVGRTRGRVPQPGSGEKNESALPAAAPTGDLTVFEAVSRQLGLKLAPAKHPMPVVVIDHVERKPTAN